MTSQIKFEFISKSAKYNNQIHKIDTDYEIDPLKLYNFKLLNIIKSNLKQLLLFFKVVVNWHSYEN